MPDTQSPTEPHDEPVSVTLQLDPKVHEFFLRKAQKAGVGIESFLSSTLAIVLGCRAFDENNACSPQPAIVAKARDDAQKLR
jgi:hypothetical protein